MPADAAPAVPRRHGSRWLLVVALVFGAIFGVAVSTLWHRDASDRDPRSTTKDERGAAPPVVAAGNPHESAAIAKMRALEERLQVLEAERNQDSGTKPKRREPLSPEQGRALVRAEVDRVRHEARDPSWAPSAERSLATELRDLTEKGRFELGTVSCGTTSCIAEVTWDVDAHPVEYARVILHHPFALNCERTVVAPTPEELVSGAKNRGQVLLDCTEARAAAMR